MDELKQILKKQRFSKKDKSFIIDLFQDKKENKKATKEIQFLVQARTAFYLSIGVLTIQAIFTSFVLYPVLLSFFGNTIVSVFISAFTAITLEGFILFYTLRNQKIMASIYLGVSIVFNVSKIILSLDSMNINIQSIDVLYYVVGICVATVMPISLFYVSDEVKKSENP